MTVSDPVLYYPLDLFKLGMSAGATGRDVLLLDALETASRGVEEYCGDRRFYPSAVMPRVFRVRDRIVCCPDGDELLVDDIAAAPTLVEVRAGGRAGAWRPVTAYDLDPDTALERGRPVGALLADAGTWGTDRVRITTSWGWPVTPRPVREATKLLANRLYLRKDSPDGTAGVGEWGPVRVAASDPDVRALLEPFRLESAG